ncbi:unnamed protein product [Arabidopsis lyrata]|uniref:uncharacterized protein LOC9325535 n=1 Tax=Arabidopsis lyrata subsp. lyrata TaxID=81972 RepID=UPI000A29D090|nr:uncharacterized protein LOC9325535 [Arabidopsis lyrata subsp. lyrata]CAH8251055.1 unnamed protein product [Arabidopsis lyrata]|eukprot:XP_020866476.1 uncharacterized protein LOC9325535 [Arabidopsis lyrata subsp. lyrata]
MEDPSLSTEPEVMDLSSSCGKRKAETISPDEGCEEEERNSESDDQVWGFDSFEGSDYESPDEPPEDDEELELRRYTRHYHESQGFKVDKDKLPKYLTYGLRGLDLDAHFFKPNLTGREYMEIMANVAIDKYNQVENKTVTLDHIVRVVVQMSYGIKGYITFMAKESPHGELVEYQAKAERKAWQRNIHPIFCRPAPS